MLSSLKIRLLYFTLINFYWSNYVLKVVLIFEFAK